MNNSHFGRVVIVLAAIAVIGSIVGAIMIFPPSEQRLHRLDERRTDDLSRIDRSIKSYWDKHKELPADLAELDREPGIDTSITDPETGAAYDYKKSGEKSYQLCATFATDSKRDNDDDYRRYWSGDWAHTKGSYCFNLVAPK